MKRIPKNWEHLNKAVDELRKTTADPHGYFSSGFTPSGRVLFIDFNYNKPGFKKTYTVKMLVRYCPFSGKKLFEDENE